MKKLFFAGAFALALMTSCQNSESQISSPEDQKGVVFQSRAAARGGEELPPLSAEEEKAVIEEAIETLRLDREAELKGENGDAGRKPLILCHTSYSSPSGHACVYNSSGYLVDVSWGPKEYHFGTGGETVGVLHGTLVYSGHVTPRCNC